MASSFRTASAALSGNADIICLPEVAFDYGSFLAETEKILNEKGINLDLDNVASIKAFQKAMGLKPDGKIGPKTLKAMGLEK